MNEEAIKIARVLFNITLDIGTHKHISILDRSKVKEITFQGNILTITNNDDDQYLVPFTAIYQMTVYNKDAPIKFVPLENMPSPIGSKQLKKLGTKK